MRSTKKLFMVAIALLAAVWCVPSASAQEATSPYRATRRDPFTGYKVYFKRKVAKKESAKPVPVDPPSIQARIEQYKAQKRAAMSLQQPAPKPTTALLLKEVQVTGIFRTPRGFAAMIEATPISLSYVIYPGEPFFDGMLVAIEDSRLVFRHETRWTDGRSDVKVETKPLRQPNVADSMAAQKPAAPAQNSSDPVVKKEEKPPVPGNN